MPSGVYVIGGGGHAKVVVSSLQDMGVSVLGIWDDDAGKWGRSLLGVPIIGGLDGARQYAGEAKFVLAIGDNETRRALAERLADFEWATVVHPTAYLHSSVEVGPGTVVFAGAVVQPGVGIGRHCIINTGATVDHDCQIGDFTHLAPGVNLAGGVVVESRAMLGVGAAVVPGVRIGEGAVVGAGSVVIGDVDPGDTVAGVPARPLHK